MKNVSAYRGLLRPLTTRLVPALVGLALLATAALAQAQTPTFAPVVPYSTGSKTDPISIAVADVNGDGKPDLLTADFSFGSAGVLLGNGNGTFQPVVLYSTGTNSGPASIAVADVNGDGKPDLLTANTNRNTAGVLLGNGNGTFQAVVSYSTGGSISISIAVADVNGDGRPDLLTANDNTSTAGVLLGNGNGTFQAVVPYSTGTNSSPQSIAVADVNGDGRPDLLTANNNTSTAGVLLGNGNGTFQAVVPYSTGTNSSPVSIVVADVNGDGRPDLLTANGSTSTAGVLLGNGNGTFQAVVPYDTGANSNPYSIAVADVNGDGRPDLLTANGSTSTAGVLLGNGNGTFQAVVPYDTGANSNPYSIAVADVNGDGKPDLLTANTGSNTAGVLLNTTVFAAPTLTSLSPTSGPVGTSVTLTGTALSGATGVRFNSTAAATFAVVNATTATAIVPPGATTGNVTITTPGGTSNGVAFVVGTPTNNALAFDGLNTNVSIPASTAYNLTTAFTIETWLKPAGGGASVQDVLCKSSNSQNTGYIFPRTDDTWNSLRFWLHRGGGWSQYTVPYAAYVGSWHHVAATYDGTTVRLYIDGVAVTPTASGAVGTGPVATNTNPLTLGNQPGFAENYKGALDEARLYNAVLTQGQIQADMFSTASALPSSQVYYANFDQGVAGGSNAGVTSLTDQSGNNNTGTLSNFALTGTTSNWVRSFPTITGLTPATGPVGSSVSVTGTNLLDATGFKFNTAAVAPFTAPTNDLSATVSVPSGATTGPLSVSSATLTAYNGPVFTLSADLVVSTGTQTNPTVIPAGTYNSITVTSTGNVMLAGNVIVNTSFTVQPGGGLSDGCRLISGAGSFTLGAGSILGICNAAGITSSGATGAVQVTGTRSFSTGASYGYTGAAAVTGNGLPGTVANLAINTAGNVTLTAPVAISVAVGVGGAGNLVLNGHALTLLSSAAGTALAVNTSTGAVVGTATVQRYIDPRLNPGLGYRHYSAPVSNTTVADLATAGFAPMLTTSYNTSATPGTTTPFPTVFGYDQARVTLANSFAPFDRGFVVPVSPDVPLAVGRGYAVNIDAAQLVDFVGTLTTGDQTVNLNRNPAASADAAAAGWQLLGNPYPAPLDYGRVAPTDRPTLDAAIYVYSSTGPYVGTYRAYLPPADGGSAIGNGVLPVAQGFFVRVSAGLTSGSLTFRNAQRLISPQATPFQRGTADTRPLVQLELRGATGPADPFYAYATAGATPAFDSQFDAVKLPNTTGLNLASRAEGAPEGLAIDARPAFTAATVLPLTVGVPAAGTYTLSAAALTNLPAGLDAYLSDALTGQTINLGQQPRYAFAVSPAQAQAGLSTRFSLGFSPQAILATHAGLHAGEVSLFPNPAHDSFTVLVPAVTGTSQLRAELLNALGQVVRRLNAALPADGASLHVDTAGLAGGVYILRLSAGPTTLTKRVVLH